MVISVKHAFTSLKTDGGDTTLIRPSNWNAEHTILAATKTILGRFAATDGAIQEIAIGDSMTLDTTTGKLDTNNTGMLGYFALAAAPVGWLKANGAAVNRVTYAKLFTAIGTTYGAGDGSTTFNLPDFRGYFLRGLDDGRGVDASRVLGSIQADAFASHGHGVNDPTHAHSIADGGHSHGVNDPGHAHNPSWGGGFVTVGAGVGNIGTTVGGAGLQGGTSTDARGTGIWLSASGTGIGIYGAGTGISIQANGGAETRPKNYAALICIRY